MHRSQLGILFIFLIYNLTLCSLISPQADNKHNILAISIDRRRINVSLATRNRDDDTENNTDPNGLDHREFRNRRYRESIAVPPVRFCAASPLFPGSRFFLSPGVVPVMTWFFWVRGQTFEPKSIAANSNANWIPKFSWEKFRDRGDSFVDLEERNQRMVSKAFYSISLPCNYPITLLL